MYGESYYDPGRGFAWADIQNADTQESNTVEIVILPGGRSEVVRICGNVALSITVKSGEGSLRRYDMSTDEYHSLRLGDLGANHALLIHGDTYFYTNDGPEPLVLRDTSTPPFRDGDEVSLEG